MKRTMYFGSVGCILIIDEQLVVGFKSMDSKKFDNQEDLKNLEGLSFKLHSVLESAFKSNDLKEVFEIDIRTLGEDGEDFTFSLVNIVEIKGKIFLLLENADSKCCLSAHEDFRDIICNLILKDKDLEFVPSTVASVLS